MNQEELQQKIAEYYSKLPENLQKFFADMNWLNTLQEINTKYNLSGEQIEILSTETTLALLCIIPMDDYVNAIENNMKLSSEQKEQLMSEINDKIFKDIGYDLEDTFTKNVNGLSEEKYGGEKKLDERFNSLPKEVQEAISQSDYQSKLYEISQNHKLNMEQMGMLEEVTTKVILNIIHPDQYESSLADKLNMGREEVSKIVIEINDNVLKNIREKEKMITNDQSAFSADKLPINNEEKENTVKNEIGDEVPLPPYKTVTNDQSAFSVDKLPINNENQENKETDKEDKQRTINPLEEKMIKPVSSTNIPPQNTTPGADPYRELV